MKYKYTRKQIAKCMLEQVYVDPNIARQMKKDLLAKEQGECKHKSIWHNGEKCHCFECGKDLTQSQPKEIEKVEDECKDIATWVKQLWKKQCELIDAYNNLSKK